MKAMILAAGRGERMRPLTDLSPKPLLPVGDKPLIVWHLERLAVAGIDEVVINTAHLGEQLVAVLGDGAAFGLAIRWSPEPPGALETAGGVRHALPLLGERPFLLISGDIWCDLDVAALASTPLGNDLAHLVLVPNPDHHSEGDFTLAAGRVALGGDGERLTYSGIGLYQPTLFAPLADGTPLALRVPLRAAVAAGRVRGAAHYGDWEDIGTPERLAALDYRLRHP
jgi:MurNAc alpha-1-phosphate uridylyltransferase